MLHRPVARGVCGVRSTPLNLAHRYHVIILQLHCMNGNLAGIRSSVVHKSRSSAKRKVATRGLVDD